MEGRTPAFRQRSPKAIDVYPDLSVQDRLASLVGVVDHSRWMASPDGHVQGVQHQLGAQVAGHTCACTAGASVLHPTTRRLQASTTTARYTHPGHHGRNPLQVGTYVMSAPHSRFGPLAAKSRLTRSGAGWAPTLRTVVRGRLRHHRDWSVSWTVAV